MDVSLPRRDVVLGAAVGALLWALWWVWGDQAFEGTARSLALVHGTVLALALAASWAIGRTPRKAAAAFLVMAAAFGVVYLIASGVFRAMDLAACDDRADC
jgi:hypothetical protein